MSGIELLSRQAAAEWLAEQLPEKDVGQWALWLRNNANTARQAPYRIEVQAIGRGSFYTPEELTKFVEFEKGRQFGRIKLTSRAAEVIQAFDVGSGSGLGHQWQGGYANPARRETAGDGEWIVQAVIENPLRGFAMSPEQAIAFGNQLIDAAQHASRMNSGEGAKTNSRYETVVDTPDLQIKRKID